MVGIREIVGLTALVVRFGIHRTCPNQLREHGHDVLGPAGTDGLRD
jgi:hypothetical protein